MRMLNVALFALLFLAPRLEAQTVAIVGGTVVPVTGPRIENATVLIRDGRIASVARGIQVPADAQVIDARGRYVYPGLIDSETRLGISEISQISAGQDINEIGDFNPAMSTYIAVNPHSELIPVTRVNGVTTAVSTPSGGRIAGTSALIDLDGWTPLEMSRRHQLAVVVSFPLLERPPAGGGGFGGGFGGGQQLSDEEFRRRGERQVRELEEYLEQARVHSERVARGVGPARPDRQLEAMIPVMRGERPLAVQANGSAEILAAIALGEKFGVRVVITGGRDAWKVADTLAAKGVGLILGQITSSPPREAPFDAIYAQPGMLARAGVKFAFSTSDAANARNLPYNAALAVAHGLDPEDALRAMTSWPAEIWGVSEEVGSIEVGKVANLFIADGDPMDVRTNVEQVFIRGRPIEMDTRHTRLYERFRGRPRVDTQQ